MQTAGSDNDDIAPPAAETNSAPARKETKAQTAKRKKEEEVQFFSSYLSRLSADHLIRKPLPRLKPQNNSNVDENNLVQMMR